MPATFRSGHESALTQTLAKQNKGKKAMYGNDLSALTQILLGRKALRNRRIDETPSCISSLAKVRHNTNEASGNR
jgi:hypothetical protein